MKAKVFHYDMTNRDLVFELSMMPLPEVVSKAWQDGQYRLAFDLEFDMGVDEQANLDTVYVQTQDPHPMHKQRSTSVGDVIILNGQGWVVMPFGFSAVTL